MSRLATGKSDTELGRDVVYTYRYLRAGMVGLLVMLVFSVGYQVVMARGCVLGSISGYYFTPVRTVFVGSLCALGALLIAHKARSHEEDVLLDFSGVMAFIVAMVPTVTDSRCPGSATLPAADVANAVRNNIWALIFLVVGGLIARWAINNGTGHVSLTSTGGKVATAICGAVLVIELGFFLLKRESFISLSHGIAAGTMVAGIIAVMVLNAVGQAEDERGRRFRTIYLGVAIALGISLAAAVAMHLWLPGFGHFILLAELIIIALFIAFWVAQTIELWREEPKQIQRQVDSMLPR